MKAGDMLLLNSKTSFRETANGYSRNFMSNNITLFPRQQLSVSDHVERINALMEGKTTYPSNIFQMMNDEKRCDDYVNCFGENYLSSIM